MKNANLLAKGNPIFWFGWLFISDIGPIIALGITLTLAFVFYNLDIFVRGVTLIVMLKLALIPFNFFMDLGDKETRRTRNWLLEIFKKQMQFLKENGEDATYLRKSLSRQTKWYKDLRKLQKKGAPLLLFEPKDSRPYLLIGIFSVDESDDDDFVLDEASQSESERGYFLTKDESAHLKTCYPNIIGEDFFASELITANGEIS